MSHLTATIIAIARQAILLATALITVTGVTVRETYSPGLFLMVMIGGMALGVVLALLYVLQGESAKHVALSVGLFLFAVGTFYRLLLEANALIEPVDATYTNAYAPNTLFWLAFCATTAASLQLSIHSVRHVVRAGRQRHERQGRASHDPLWPPRP